MAAPSSSGSPEPPCSRMPRCIGAAVTVEMPINRARARPTVRERAASKPLEREEAPRKCCAVRGAIDIIFFRKIPPESVVYELREYSGWMGCFYFRGRNRALGSWGCAWTETEAVGCETELGALSLSRCRQKRKDGEKGCAIGQGELVGSAVVSISHGLCKALQSSATQATVVRSFLPLRVGATKCDMRRLSRRSRGLYPWRLGGDSGD